MKKAEIRKPLLEMVESITVPLGFEKRKTNEGYEYVKKSANGFISVIPIIYQYSTLFFVSIGFGIRINEMSKITLLFSDINPEFWDEATTINCGFSDLVQYDDNRIKVETPEELSSALEILKNVLANEAMEFFKKYETVESIDAEVNRENLPKDSIFFGVSVQPFLGLTSAVLNKNPKAKYWENYYKEKLINANQHIKNQYEKLVDHLNENYSSMRY